MIGNAWASDLLREHVRSGRLRHAYLLTGPQGVGRRTLALRLAQAINCTQPPAPGEPCLTCPTCRQIGQRQHPDLSVIQRLPEKTQIVVDQVRLMQHSLALHPYSARFRVALMLHTQDATIGAQNALLKTLEEPGPRVVLLLTAESSELLLPTIVSRCEILRLRPAPVMELSHALEQRLHISSEKAEMAARLSGGRPGVALDYAQDPALIEARRAMISEHLRLIHAGRLERFAFADALTRGEKDKDLKRENLRQTLLTWLSIWRDVLLHAGGSSVTLTNPDFQTEIQALAQNVGFEPSRAALEAILKTQELLKSNVNDLLAMEVLLLNLPRA